MQRFQRLKNLKTKKHTVVSFCCNNPALIFNGVRNKSYLQNEPVLKRNYTHPIRYYCSSATAENPVDSNVFEKVCEETLESLTEYFEEVVEGADNLESADVSYGGGVLTVNLGPKYGTYVINRQSPNRQIWLSSPTSGPKRYDFSVSKNCWIYKHDMNTLHSVLQEEISQIVKNNVDFSRCCYAKV